MTTKKPKPSRAKTEASTRTKYVVTATVEIYRGPIEKKYIREWMEDWIEGQSQIWIDNGGAVPIFKARVRSVDLA